MSSTPYMRVVSGGQEAGESVFLDLEFKDKQAAFNLAMNILNQFAKNEEGRSIEVEVQGTVTQKSE